MTGECIEIAVHLADVGRKMDNSLGAVDQYKSAVRMTNLHYLLYRVHNPQNIRNLGDTTEFRAGSKSFLQYFERNLTSLIYGQNIDFQRFIIFYKLPGHDIRVVLGLTYEDFVILGKQIGADDRTRQKIDRLCSAGSEHDFFGRRGSDERGDIGSRAFVLLGRNNRCLMDGSMKIGIEAKAHFLPLPNNGKRTQ